MDRDSAPHPARAPAPSGGAAQPSHAPPGRRLGALISAVFGVVYVEVNAGLLPAGVTLVLRILGAGAFLVILVRLRLDEPHPAAASDRDGVGFGTRYWLIVAAEVAGIVLGSAVLRGVGLGSATVAWVSVVVGVHLLALGATWRVRLFRPLGTAIAGCGAMAIVAAAAGAGDGWIAAIGGVLPGALLLWAAAYRGGLPGRFTSQPGRFTSAPGRFTTRRAPASRRRSPAS